MSINRQSERDIARERAYALQQSIGMNQARDTGLAAVMTESQKKRHTAKLDETRQLKGHPSDYLTSLEPSWEYISYFGGHDDYEKGFMEGHSSGMADGMNIIERSYAEKGVDLDKFKQECKGIDDEN